MDKLLVIEPQVLCFPVKLKEKVCCLVRLYNKTPNHVAFKVMTTSPNKYCVRPNLGIILPGSSCDVTVIMCALNEAPPNMECKDKFLIRSALASPLATTEDIHELLNSEDGDIVQKCKLGVIYTLPSQVSSPVAITSLLDIQPSELRFPFELKKQLSCLLRLSNMTDNHVGFKVRNTETMKYCVQPNLGIVLPRSTWDVIVTMQAQTKIPLPWQWEDKFLIESIVTSPAAITKPLTSAMFETGRNVEVFKLKVVYTFPPHPQPSNNPDASTLPERNLIDFETTPRKLLEVQPSELQFPFELKKQISCLLQLSNMTEKHVAFKVKTTNPKMYCVQPNIGIVLPRSTCDVIVTMQAQTTIPLDGQSKDKFLIQSLVISPAATTETLSSEMFETGCNVQEFKLKVVYTFPPHPESSNNRTSEADSSGEASTLPERNSNDTEDVQELKNETIVGDLVVKGIIIGLLGLISWFLIMKMLPLIWSMTFLIMMLVVKMIKSIVSDSVEDWIVKSLVYIFFHFVSILFGRKWNITSSS